MFKKTSLLDDSLSQDHQNKENILQNHSTSSFNSENSLSTATGKINETYQLNEKVTNLATSIYQELEKIIKEFGRDTVKDLMPIVVNILEALDLAYQEKEELKVENELYKDDNEQLLNQYEREKQFRKDCEQKQFQLEDLLVEQKKEYDEKIQSLESIVRMIELKSKNSGDHVARLEEKEIEMKREYTKLHERYTELFKTHCDYMERNKILYGVNADDDNDNDTNHRSKKRQQQQNHQQSQQKPIDDFIRNKIIKNAISSDAISQLTTNSNRNEITTVITNLLQEIEQQHQIKQEDEETKLNDINREYIIDTNRVDDDFNEHITSDFDVNKEIEIESEDEAYSKNDLSLYNELSRENYDPSEVDDGADLSGMTREVANLIRENTELLQTKHALNVLKDDLIAKLDNFSSEMIILKEEINSLQYVKGCLQLRISELEEESKKTREESAAANNNSKNDKNSSSVEDDDGPTSQRKRFTRVEMARVLMERNQYKERLMDLQEAVRWTEYMRASKADPTLSLQNNNNKQNLNEEKKKSPIWKFFSGLFGSKTQQEQQQQQQQQQSPTRQNDRSNVEQVVPYSELNNTVIPEKVAKAYEFLVKENINSSNTTSAPVTVKKSGDDKQLQQSILKDKCRIQAYGWSLPSKNETNETSDVNNLAIPVPIYCQPIYDRDNDLKPSCATILNSNDEKSSSLVWICSLCKNDTYVSILDPNSPKEQKEQFVLKSMKVLCVQSVKGSLETSNETVKTEESSLKATCLNSTVWFGTQEGWLLVHNSCENLTSSLSKIKLKDAVLSILQNSNIVIVGLADGSIILFSCDAEYWDLKNYKSIALDLSHCSVRSIINVSNDDVWCGVGNKIYDINPHKLEIMAEIEAHPRKESQVRNMVCVGEGVWVSIRLDSTIRLFHAKTKQHLQYLDIEPFVTRMLGTSSLGLSLTRITSLISASNYLWIGTGNGAIISIPFTQKDDLPYCNLNKAQFSFHGHRDTVRFFLYVAGKGLHKGVQQQQQQQQSVNNTSNNKTMLVLSGGQGYVDFRVSDATTAAQIDSNNNINSSTNSKIDKSYLIVWQI